MNKYPAGIAVFGPDGPLARHGRAGILPGVRVARLAGGRGALRQRLWRLLVQAGPLAAAALLGCRLAHVEHGALEPLGLLGDGAEAPALEAGPRVAVALERPPLVAAVHLLDEREVAVAEPLAYGPVARAERFAEPVETFCAGELVGVLLEERVVLPVEAADFEPAVLLALLHEPFVLAAGNPLEAVHGRSAFRFLVWRAAASRWGHGASRSRRACRRVGAAQDVYSDFDCGNGRGRPRWVELGRAVRASMGCAQVSRAGACPFRPGRRACRSGRSCSRSPLP